MLTLCAAVVGFVLLAGEVTAMPRSAATPSRPGENAAALSLVQRDPLTLRGSGFGRRERVRVDVVYESGAAERRARADLTGAFVVVFPRGQIGRCEALSAHAIGSRGSRARLRTFSPACIE